MKATQVLMDEHRVIEQVLTALQTSLPYLIPGGSIKPDFYLQAADFIKNFADGCHHRKEEGVLFIAMEKAGVPVQGGPIGVMLAEHEQGRQFTRSLRAAAEAWQAGNNAALTELQQNALGYANLLRQHIYKEDNILFPMADKALPTDVQSQVWQDFERIEVEETGAGVHEKYHALAHALLKESQVLA